MENKPKFSLVKWGALGLGVLLGVSHFSMIGLLSNRKTLPKINLPVGPYTAYEVEASHDGYRISYRANDPKVMTVQKDIKTKAGFLGLGNNKTRIQEEYTVRGAEHIGGGSNENKISAAQAECIKAQGGGEQTGRIVGGSVGTIAAAPLANVPVVGWVLAGAATMMGMEEGGNIGADMAQMGKDCVPEDIEIK